MKKTLLFVALIAVGCAEPIPRNLDDLSMQGPQYLDPETLDPYSGPAFRMSEDDPTQIVLRVNLRDGRFHGDFEDFELAGDSLGIYQTGTYRDGQKEGRTEFFYPSGVLYARASYENDEAEGTSETYYETGQLQEKGIYLMGELDGPFENYYENGQLEATGTYVAGELDGLAESYHENGEPRNRINYVAGELDGPYESYHENGQLWGKYNYVAGEYDGPSEAYHEDGQLQQKGVWNMGEACGEWIVEGEVQQRTPCPPGLSEALLEVSRSQRSRY